MGAWKPYLCVVCGESDRKNFYHIIKDGVEKASSKSLCKDHYNERQRVAHQGRKDQVADRVLLKTFGITREEYDAQLERQGGRCAGCQITREEDIENRGRRWPVDHDHETGEVRGILCWLCNLALGGVRDSSATLRRLADYVDRGGVWGGS